MIRVVIDTGVLIRYLIRPGAAITELIEERWLGDQVRMVTALDLMAELEGVLKRDYVQTLIRADEGQALLDVIAHRADVLPALGPVPAYTGDPKDDKFVACALVGDASWLVTEDKDLLVLDVVGGVRIVTPYDFLGLIPQ